MSPVDKAAIERELDAEWQALRAEVESLSDEELQEPGVVEEWSVKDLLGHIAFWATKAAGDLELARSGRSGDIKVPFIPDPEGSGGQNVTDEWNARESAARKGRSLAEMRSEWERSFEAAKEALRATPAETLETEVKGWDMLTRFAEDTYRHYREHAEQIRAWKRDLETTEE